LSRDVIKFTEKVIFWQTKKKKMTLIILRRFSNTKDKYQKGLINGHKAGKKGK
jgi:hypothetical protein